MLELLMGKWKETAAFCLTLLVGQTRLVAVRAAALRMQFARGGPQLATGYIAYKEAAMGFFRKILDKLGIGNEASANTQRPSASAGAGTAVEAPPQPVAVVDVVAQLEQRAA